MSSHLPTWASVVNSHPPCPDGTCAQAAHKACVFASPEEIRSGLETLEALVPGFAPNLETLKASEWVGQLRLRNRVWINDEPMIDSATEMWAWRYSERAISLQARGENFNKPQLKLGTREGADPISTLFNLEHVIYRRGRRDKLQATQPGA